MQSYDLTVDKFLDHAAKWWGNCEVVTSDSGRINCAALRARSDRLLGALAKLGLRTGDRGEWSNPIEIETIVGRLPGVGMVAITSQADENWGDRPILVVEPQTSHSLDGSALLDARRGNVADWGIPDLVIQVAHMPLAATGKIDKNRLRAQYTKG